MHDDRDDQAFAPKNGGPQLTEGFDLSPREAVEISDLDDLGLIVRSLRAKHGPVLGPYGFFSAGAYMGSARELTYTVALDTFHGYGPTMAEAIADAEGKLAARAKAKPSPADLAATLGIELAAANGGVR